MTVGEVVLVSASPGPSSRLSAHRSVVAGMYEGEYLIELARRTEQPTAAKRHIRAGANHTTHACPAFFAGMARILVQCT